MNLITPMVWINGNVQEVIKLYQSTFPNVVITTQSFYPEKSQMPKGTPLVTEITIFSRKIQLLNAEKHDTLNPSISFFIYVKDKELVNTIWNNLTKKGNILMPLGEYPFANLYGWCSDEFGVNFQLMYSETIQENYMCPSMMFTGANTGKAKEAIDFYTQIFSHSKIINISYYGENIMKENPKNINYSEFELSEERFNAMDSGLDHKFTFNDGVSFVITCNDQREIDYYWDNFINNGGSEVQCGWCKDKYGVSWQVVPKNIGKLMSGPNGGRVAEKLFAMKKLIIKDLENAYEG